MTELRLLAGVSPDALARRLGDHPLTACRRHGKHLLVRAGASGWLALHFGMTGYLACRRVDDGPEEFARVVLHLDGGRRLAVVSRQMPCEVGWTDDPDAFVNEPELGPDLLADDLDTRGLARRAAESRRAVKAALTDQSLVAGLGNVYGDEALFQAGIDPRMRARDLGPDGLRSVLNVARRVARTAARHRAGNRLDSGGLPSGWLLPHREEGAGCPAGCGGMVRKVTVSGRPTYPCPRCQERAG